MADLSITAANVVAGSNSVQEHGLAGEAIVAGKAVYKASATKKWMLADSNSATAEAKVTRGIALNGAALNQPVTIHKFGDLTLGSVLTAGTSYYLSDTPGGICVFADLASGEDVSFIGVAKSSTVLAVNVNTPGVTL
ncbi:hypothetical protein [Ancylobacter radicis]|uniref:Head decoration protein n=1 Tax=Ancylobacter radicis TaxID=2836179 RepID=A0ABS5R3K7_9HYPH|nr:hypothetical protein [Ancylobacter radicis]MBS9476235.1 hypothetical protein [Ancylobacter radicis]